ncbi:bile acid:sodium symporter family protein [Sporomusa sp.]|uniref:bile acid:sodium symporter family protein n=1 Tax=Sporomusa sp. TaxID=2078658 RepID=UPI002C8BDD6D|nr:bile acid:sodium symporter family protein [Sporomusa sp.]HWR44634.1 bile acid:sodium symporter family protein [Sporomusa sp.]
MINYLAKLTAWLGQRMFLIVLSALFLGFISPISDSAGLRTIVIGSFAYMTFVTALDTSFKEFLQVLKRPVIPAWILVLIHIVSPLIAWLTGLVLFAGDHYTQLGYLVGASTPIGVTSVIWTALTQGNVSIALVAVTLDTLIVPIMLPFFFKVVIGQALQIDYMQMMVQLLLMVTVPSLLGMALHDYSRGILTPAIKTVANFISKMAFFAVIFINAAIVGPSISWDISTLKIVLITMFLVAAGYLIGFLGSYVFKDRSKETALAMIYCVGLRNISFGLVLALSFFPPPVAVPITMFILYQQPFAAAIPYLFRKLVKGTA